ncbi:hypothetical protein MRI28_26055 [Nocardiopsis dassonvillei]|nr:hypothetical protein [Nocardiopsis dassonvillei]
MPARPRVPALSGVLLTGDTDGTLTATGFDYSTAITVTVPDVVTTPGRALLTHADLSGVLAATAKGTPKKRAGLSPVTVTSTGDATLEVDGYTLPIEAHDPDDFPTLPAPPPDTATLGTTGFVAELSRVTPAAASPEWCFPTLENVRITCDRGKRIDMIATDRYRIAWATLTATPAPGVDAYSDEAVLVNARLLDRLRRYLTGDTLTLALGDDLCGLTCGPVRVLTRGYSESEYPKNMADLVPDRAPVTVTVDRGSLARATDRARAILTAKKETATPIAVTIADGAVSIGPDLSGAVAPDLDATTTGLAGEPVRLRFHPRYLSDALASFTGRTATVHLTAPTKPVVVTDGGATPDTAGYRHLIMPIRPRT